MHIFHATKPERPRVPLTPTQNVIVNAVVICIGIIAFCILAGIAVLAGKFLVFAVRL